MDTRKLTSEEEAYERNDSVPDTPSAESSGKQADYLDDPIFYFDQFLPENHMYYAPLDEHQQGDSIAVENQATHYDVSTSSSSKQEQASSMASYLKALADFSQPNSAALASSPPQRIWSGINNFLANVNPTNIFRPTLAIPNIATRFSEYLSNYPASLWTTNWLPNGEHGEQSQVQEQNLNLEYMPSIPQVYPEETMQIRVLGIPQTGAKSRVETQIKLCLQLVTRDGEKAEEWTHLKLPEKTVTKDKLNKKKRAHIADTMSPILSNEADAEHMLFLRAIVKCASDESKQVKMCSQCIQRERKRLQRRRDAQNTRKDEENSLTAFDEQRILLFNCADIIEFDSSGTILPTRITCYCRHHNERIGFSIHFEMLDYKENIVAKGVSPPIMITDDHKSTKTKPTQKRSRSLESADDPLSRSATPTKAIKHEQLLEQSILHSETQTHEPCIQRVVPDKVPVRSTFEVTILGSGFYPGLICMFGGVAAPSTQYWSPHTLVCRVPLTFQACVMQVTLEGGPENQKEVSLTFCTDHERSLMELALQVVGMKMTGNVEDPTEIARRIISDGD